MKKPETIKNPLTLIAIFAGLSDVAMTSVLPFLQSENESIFMWFVMFYTSLLAGIFFYILIWKREALYAPSDFKDDATWLEVYRNEEHKILAKYPVERAIVSPSESTNVSNQIEKQDTMEQNDFYGFLKSLGLTHDNIKLIISSVHNVDELPGEVSKLTSMKGASEKITRILNDFQRSKNDFYKLKSML